MIEVQHRTFMGAGKSPVKNNPRATLPPDTNSLSCPINKHCWTWKATSLIAAHKVSRVGHDILYYIPPFSQDTLVYTH